MKILVINPGSTSTKIALYEDERPLWVHNNGHSKDELSVFAHIYDQYAFRMQCIRQALSAASIPLEFDAVVGRGGLLHPTPGGVYAVNETMKHDLLHARREHACSLGAFLAEELAKEAGGCPAFIADPVVVDELDEKSRLTGIPEIKRLSVFHALNSKAVSRKYAQSIGRTYEELNLIVAHLGGGISVSAHRNGRVVDVNNALDGEAPFSPERAGTLPAGQLVELCFSGKYTMQQIKAMLHGVGGLAAYLGTTHVPDIVKRIEEDDARCALVLEAMLYTVAKQIGAMHVALRGKTDAIILTGGIAYSSYCTQQLTGQIDYLAPVVLMPGEDEMGSLAYNALGAMNGTLPLREYGKC